MSTIIIATEHWRDHNGGWFPLVFVGLWVFVIFTVGPSLAPVGLPARRGRARRALRPR